MVDSFDVSYGDPQTVAVIAKRALEDLRLKYRIDGGRTQTASVSEWAGGERYGDENVDYYAEFRGTVSGAGAGRPGGGPGSPARTTTTSAASASPTR